MPRKPEAPASPAQSAAAAAPAAPPASPAATASQPGQGVSWAKIVEDKGAGTPKAAEPAASQPGPPQARAKPRKAMADRQPSQPAKAPPPAADAHEWPLEQADDLQRGAPPPVPAAHAQHQPQVQHSPWPDLGAADSVQPVPQAGKAEKPAPAAEPARSQSRPLPAPPGRCAGFVRPLQLERMPAACQLRRAVICSLAGAPRGTATKCIACGLHM